jgi:hypothetical protein
MKPYFSKTGAWVNCESIRHNGFYAVMLIDPSGNIHDRIMTDDYKSALDYRRSFIKIANQLAGA